MWKKADFDVSYSNVDEGADLDTSEVGTSPPPELDTSGHTYIRHRYIRHRYNE